MATRFAMVTCMNDHLSKSDSKRFTAESEFRQLLESVCKRGFFGSAAVTVSLQDGHVQHTRVTVERMHK